MIVVGAPYAHEVESASVPPGAAYVYERKGETWSQSAKLQAIVPRPGDNFGSGVGVSDSSFAVSDDGDASGSRGFGGDPRRSDATMCGAVYLYSRDAQDWMKPTFVKAANADARDSFGYSLVFSDQRLIVSAPSERSARSGVNPDPRDNRSRESGAVYAFR